MTADDRVAAAFARRAVLTVMAATVLLYGATVALCLPSLDVGLALGVALLPAFFGGPFAGGLVLMILWNRANGDDAAEPVVVPM